MNNLKTIIDNFSGYMRGIAARQDRERVVYSDSFIDVATHGSSLEHYITG